MPAPLPFFKGMRFTRLVTIKELPGNGRIILCKCDCGAMVKASYKSLRIKNTMSCGCLRSDMVRVKNTKHGHASRGSRAIEYGHWRAMRQRCNDENSHKYPTYGAVGVKVCDRWNDFALFLEDMGPIPSESHSLDRFPDRHGNYEPGNVRWATASQQVRNRDCMDVVTYEGEEVVLIDLAERFGIDVGRLRWRLQNGWDIETALTTPTRIGRNQYDRK